MISGKQNRVVKILRCVFGHRIENAISRFRKSRAKRVLQLVERRLARIAVSGAVMACSTLMLANTAYAQMPTGADVVAGSAVINTAGPVMDVNAASARTIINWDQFSVGTGNTANFNLPDASSAILNRVTTPDMPSMINGALNSNGHVYLVNPSGVVVGAGGMINTNAFVASTFDIDNCDFLKGGALTFSDNGSTAAVVNNGTINTAAGGAHLIANSITNNGVLTSVGGNITLSGGGEVTLSNGAIYVQPSQETLVGGISPTAGLIHNTGTIRATGAVTSGGEVYLANPTGNILHDGTIAAQNAATAGATIGGHVQLEADDITLTEQSSIDASGTNGGGDVLVGGDWQGTGTMNQATTVIMEAGAVIDASATENGNGGKIVLWSDVINSSSITKVAGTLIARAGELFGAGGRIETSGANVDTNGVEVDAGAANGAGGLWLIDPYNYSINASAASSIVGTLNTGTSVEVTTAASNPSRGGSTNSGDDGDITLNADIVTGAMSGAATLTLKAHRHIILNNKIDATQNGNTQSLNVKLWADSDNSGDGINIFSSADIKTGGGSFTSGNGNTATLGGVTTKVGGDMYINGNVAQTINTDGGVITINGETIVANSSAGGVTFDSGGANIVFGGSIDSGNQYTYVDGPNGQANSWNWARNDAKNGTPGGAALGDSYMVTITSRLENAIAGIAAGYRGAWIGAYRDTSTPRNWVWADGPESGQHFFTELDAGGGTARPGWYSNFGSGEPNGGPSTTGENVGQFFGNAGQWNDLGAGTTFLGTQETQYSVLGYVRETNLNPTAMTINAGSTGTVTMGSVGSGKALATLNVTSAGVTVNGNALVTTGAQTYNSFVNVISTNNLEVGASSLSLSGLNDDLLLKSVGNIEVAASTSVQTNGGDITFWSDSDNNGQGYIELGQNGMLDSRTAVDRTATTHTTGGGNITIAGGADNGSGSPSGFATATSGNTGRTGISLGNNRAAVNTFGIYSGGGDVLLKGRSGSGEIGLMWLGGGTLDAGSTGLVNIVGANTSSGHAVELGAYHPGTPLIRSAGGDANTAAVTITGTTAATGGNLGAQLLNLTVESLGAGGIDISATSGGGYGVGVYSTNILSANGDIDINGGTRGVNFSTATIGRKAGTSVATSSADITITGDRFDAAATNNIGTSGDVAIQPSAASFSSAVTWPFSSLTVSTDVNELTLGKTGNTTSIILADDITTVGTQTYHGPVTLSDDIALTTTNRNITLNGTVNSDGTARNLTVNPGTADVTFDAAVGGTAPLSSLTVNGTANVNASVTTNGAQTWTDTITIGGTGAPALTAGSLTVDAIVGGAKDFVLAADSFDFNGNIASTGAIAIRPKTSGTSMGFLSTAGTLNISAEELDLLQDGFSSITIGGTNAGDVTVGEVTSLQDDLTLQAGANSDLFVAGDLSWDSNDTLTLAAGDDIHVAANIDVNGASAGLNLHYGGTNGTTAPDTADNFYINLATDQRIRFANTASTLHIGNQTYTLLDSISGLQGMSSSGRYALADDISLFGNTYTDAFYTTTFSGKLDGLGNVVDGLKIRDNNGGNLGLFAQLTGGTVRHLGVTNFDILTDSASASSEYRIGGIVGNVGGAGTSVSVKTVLDGVWSSGVIATKSGSRQKFFFGGGMVGSQNGGAMNISRSLSTANVSSQGSTSSNLATGGLVGDIGINTNLIGHTGATHATVAYGINTSYATGSIVQGVYGSYFGSGGLVGVIFTSGGSITDSFSWSNVVGTGSFGGIAGFAFAGTYQNLYTKEGSVGSANLVSSTNYTGSTIGAATNNGTTLPSGWSAATWSTSSFPTLNSLGVPPTSLFVKILSGGTSIYGEAIAPTYQIVDASGAVVDFGTGIYADLGDATGTGTYTLDSTANAKTHSLSYLRGLSLTGDDADLYTLNPFSTAGSYTVTVRSITAVLADTGVDKVYDGNVNASSGYTPTWSFTNILPGDSATLNVGTMFFNDADVADANFFTINGLSLAGISGSNGSLIGDYVLANAFASVAANITAKPIVVEGLFANDKTYDGNTNAIINAGSVTYTGLVSGDSVGLSDLTGTFDNRNVGDDKIVSVTGALAGTDSGNYTATLPTTVTADITAKAITTSGITSANRVYDGTTTAVIDTSGLTFDGIIDGDSLTASGTTGVHANKNVGTGKTVILSGTTYGGADLGNYTITGQATTTADITAKAITASGLTVNDRVYDGTTVGTVDHSGVAFAGIITGDVLTATGTSAAFADKNVGANKTVTLSGTTYGGADVDNYSITSQNSSTADITQKSVNVSGLTANSRIYDGTTVATVDHSGVTFGGMVSGDTLTASSTIGAFDDKNVGSGKAVTLSGTTYGGADMGNYSFTDQTSTTADVTAKAITVGGLTTNNRTYDGTTVGTVDHSGVTFSGIVSGDSLTVSGTTAAFADKNVGTGKSVTLSGTTYGGADAGNYSFTDQVASMADIFRLGSVTWIGGTTGDWSDPANWAGGAIPDLANVADVVIPDGVTPKFDNNVTGPVDIDSLNGGNLQIDSGILNVADNANLDNVTQDGGQFNVAGDLVFGTATLNNGTLDVGGTTTGDAFVQHSGTYNGGSMNVADFEQNGGSLDIDGDLDVTNSFTQSPGGSINATNRVEITQTTGDLTVRNLSGRQVTLNSANGGVHLGDVTTTGTPGTLDVTAGNGDIDQLTGTKLSVSGTSTFNASGDVTLNNADNNFVGPVNASGSNVAVTDGSGGLTLGTITTPGTFTAVSTDGPINQAAGGALTIGGTTTATASQSGNPADISLDNPDNDFQGLVNASGNNVKIVDGHGGLTLDTVIASGDATLISNDGVLTQSSSGSIQVQGDTNLEAHQNGVPADIDLQNPTNSFGGVVNVIAKTLKIRSSSGTITFGNAKIEAFDSVVEENASGAVLDTNTRHGNTPSTGFLNTVERFGFRWLQAVLSWVREDTQTAEITAPQIDAAAGEVFIRRNNAGQQTATGNEDSQTK